MEIEIQNPNPTVHSQRENLSEHDLLLRRNQELDERLIDEIDSLESFLFFFTSNPYIFFKVFDFIKNINDPEHPLTLEQLDIVSCQNIQINSNSILVFFKPTIPHCSVANLIGLMIRTKLFRSISSKYKVFSL